MLGDISYDKATLQSEGKLSIHSYFACTMGTHDFSKVFYTDNKTERLFQHETIVQLMGKITVDLSDRLSLSG